MGAIIAVSAVLLAWLLVVGRVVQLIRRDVLKQEAEIEEHYRQLKERQGLRCRRS